MNISWEYWPIPMSAAAVSRWLIDAVIGPVEVSVAPDLRLSRAPFERYDVKTRHDGSILVQWWAMVFQLGADGRYRLRDPDGQGVVSVSLADYDGKTRAWVMIDDVYLYDAKPFTWTLIDAAHLKPFALGVLAVLDNLVSGVRELGGAVAPTDDGGAVKTKGTRRREMPFSAFEAKLEAACVAIWNGGRGRTPTKTAVGDTNISLRESTIDEYLKDRNLTWTAWLDAWIKRQAG